MQMLHANPPHVRLTDSEASVLRLLQPDLPASPLHCMTCGGNERWDEGVYGTFRWVVTDAKGQDVPAEYQCDCVGQWGLHRYLLSCGIRLLYQRYRWVDAGAVSEPVLDAAMAYADNLDYNLRTGWGMVLQGAGPGTGKTLLSTLLTKQIVLRGQQAFFTSAYDMLGHYTAGWKDQAAKDWFERKVRHSPFLVIDDLGKENRARTQVAEEMMDAVLRDRVSSQRPTIITTNLSDDQMQGAYGGYIASLLHESSERIHVTGEDYRPQVAQRVAWERAEGLVRPLVLQ